MKNSTLLVLILATLAASSAFAKKKPRLLYDHTATMTYHGPKVRNLVDGRTDLYYAGDYTCTPGSEHYAPDCRLLKDWIVTDAVSYIDIRNGLRGDRPPAGWVKAADHPISASAWT